MDLYEIMFYIAALAGVAVSCYYLFVRRLKHGLQAAGPYFLLAGLASIYEVVFTLWLRVDATIYFRVYGFLETMLLLYFYWQVTNVNRIYFYLFGLVYLIAFGYLLIHFEEYGLSETDQVLAPITTLIVYFFTVGWFRQKFLEMREESLLSLGTFYFVSSIFIYYSATIFLFLSSKLIFESKEVNYLVEFWVFNILMVFLTRLIFIVAIWKARKA